jgi:tRNA (adenine37-N6)-methyltransferase
MKFMETVTLTPIGLVRNSVSLPVDSGWGAVESRIELDARWAGALQGLKDFSHAQILTFLHLIAAEDREVPTQRRPRGRADMPLLGVFAQRARVRPNPVGVTACAIVRVGRTELVVRGLDAIDGTPVLDIKPYVPFFDRVESPRVPGWVEQLFEGYF